MIPKTVPASPTITPVESPDPAINPPGRSIGLGPNSYKDRVRKSLLAYAKTSKRILIQPDKENNLVSTEGENDHMNDTINVLQKHDLLLKDGDSLSTNEYVRSDNEANEADDEDDGRMLSDHNDKDQNDTEGNAKLSNFDEEFPYESVNDDPFYDNDRGTFSPSEESIHFTADPSTDYSDVADKHFKDHSETDDIVLLQEAYNEGGKLQQGVSTSDFSTAQTDNDGQLQNKWDGASVSRPSSHTSTGTAKQRPVSGHSPHSSKMSRVQSDATLTDILSSETVEDEKTLKSIQSVRQWIEHGNFDAASMKSETIDRGEGKIEAGENSHRTEKLDGLPDRTGLNLDDSVENSYFEMFKSSTNLQRGSGEERAVSHPKQGNAEKHSSNILSPLPDSESHQARMNSSPAQVVDNNLDAVKSDGGFGQGNGNNETIPLRSSETTGIDSPISENNGSSVVKSTAACEHNNVEAAENNLKNKDAQNVTDANQNLIGNQRSPGHSGHENKGNNSDSQHTTGISDYPDVERQADEKTSVDDQNDGVNHEQLDTLTTGATNQFAGDMKGIDRLRVGPLAKSLKTPLEIPPSSKIPRYTGATSHSSKVKPERTSENGERKSTGKSKIPRVRRLIAGPHGSSSQTSSVTSEDEKSTPLKEPKRRKPKSNPSKRGKNRNEDGKIKQEGTLQTKSKDDMTVQTTADVLNNEINSTVANVDITTTEDKVNNLNSVGEKQDVPQSNKNDTTIIEMEPADQVMSNGKDTHFVQEATDENKNLKQAEVTSQKTMDKKKPKSLKDWFKGKKKLDPVLANEKNKDDNSTAESTPTTNRSVVDASSIIITTTSPDPPESEKNTTDDKENVPVQNGSAPAPENSPVDSDKQENLANNLIGQVILSNIREKLQISNVSAPANPESAPTKQALQRTASQESSLGLGNSLGRSGDRTGKKMSMSSLTVPGVLSALASMEPTPGGEEDDTTPSRLDSSRMSFDSTSRKSVDIQLRDTTLVIIPNVEEKAKANIAHDETFIKSAIPFLPVSLAVCCLILNIVLPGSGTALSGVSVLCCGRPRLYGKDDQILTTLCANITVGLAQLFTVTFMLVGWFWSLGWGIHMVSLSVQYRQTLKEQRAKELQAMALSAFGGSS